MAERVAGVLCRREVASLRPASSRCGDSGPARMDAVRENPSRTGVCVVRIEAQAGSVLITLRTNTDIEQISTERVVVVADIDAAIQAVRTFLAGFSPR
jgi:hypothetical protein